MLLSLDLRRREGQTHPSHPLPFASANRKIAKSLHRRFIEDVAEGRYKSGTKHDARPTTLFQAHAEFFKAHEQGLTAAARQSYDSAFAYYMETDMPFDEGRLREHLLKRQSEPPKDAEGIERDQIVTSTRMRYMRRVKAFTRWCTARAYFRVDPALDIAVPNVRRKDVLFFTPEEVEKLVEYHRVKAIERDHARYSADHLQHALFIKLSHLIGTRPAELIRVRWEDNEPERWKIWGKAKPTKENTRTKREYRYPRLCRDENAEIRWFPLEHLEGTPDERRQWLAEIRVALDELRQFKNGGWLFKFKHTQPVNEAIQDAKPERWASDAEAAIDPRTFRNLRQSARWVMENKLGMGLYLKSDLLGHPPEVSLENYRPTSDAGVLAKKVRRGE